VKKQHGLHGRHQTKVLNQRATMREEVGSVTLLSEDDVGAVAEVMQLVGLTHKTLLLAQKL